MLRPYSLINSQGKPHYGRFTAPVNEVNVQNADYRTAMNKPAGRWKRHFHFKRFQYFGAMGKDLIFGCALADLRYIGAIFIYVYRLSDGAMRTWQYKMPLAYGLELTNRPDNGVSSFQFGKRSILMRYELNALDERKKILDIDLGPELKIHAEMREGRHFEPMALCTPCAVNGWVYAQKTAAIAVTGQVDCELGKFDLGKSECYGHHDFSAGYMRRETFWNWACFSGRQGPYPPLGLNVSWGVNETGYSENCFWVGNSLHPLPQVQFTFDRDNEHSTWRVSSLNNQINLSFKPVGMHRERLNIGLMATNFKQFFGLFNGHLQAADGQRYEIEDQYGFIEDHYSKW